MVFLMGNYTGPWGITFNPFLIAQSGRPFNVTTQCGPDRRQLLQRSSRVCGEFGSCSSGSSEFVTTSFGCLDVTRNPESRCFPQTSATARPQLRSTCA
jgi:hypothetical protein